MRTILLLFVALPALLLTAGGIAIYLTEDPDLVRLAATIGGGVAMTLLLAGMLRWAGAAAAREPRRHPGAHRPGSPLAWMILATTGLVIACVGIVMALRTHAFDHRALETEARIVEVETLGVGQQRSRRAQVSFTTTRGRAVRAELDPLPPDAEAGLRIRYDPSDPSRVAAIDGAANWRALIVLIGSGAVLCIGSVVGALRRMPRAKQ